MRIAKLGIADIRKTIGLRVVPAMAQLRLPLERRRRFQFGLNEFVDHVARVDINRADGHDFLTIAARQLAEQQGDEDAQLGDLFLVVVFDGVVVTLE